MRDSPKPTPHERRRLERYEVTDVIDVIDILADGPLGRLLDISADGMMLSSDSPIPLNQIFQVALSQPRPAARQEVISLGVESLWQRASADGTEHWTGFQLISVSDQDRVRLERMLGAL